MTIKNSLSLCTLFAVAVTVLGCGAKPVARAAIDLDFKEMPINALVIQDKRTVVVRDATELATLWAEGTRFSSGNPMPAIDFSKYMVLGVFLGEYPLIERPQLTFTSVKRRSDPDRIEVHYKITEYKRPFGPYITIYSQSSVHKVLLAERSDFPVHFIEGKE